MQIIPIQALPNQEFSIVLDENRYDIAIRSTTSSVAFTFYRNNELVIENIRAVSSIRIIPSKYQEAGNFVLYTQLGELPFYEKFGITQQLIYLSEAELNAIRARNPARMTASDFDPLGGLPLRFAPQGYTLAP